MFKLTQRSFILVICMFLLGFSSSYAQIGQLGIYGAPTIIVRANVRYVRLEDYPVCECNFSYTLPVNGHKNFNFYYTPDGMGFLPGGGYKVSYLAADQSTVYGYDIVSYSPNSGHTNGVATRAFYDPPSTPLGIHGTVYGYNSGNSSVAPINNLRVLSILGSEAEYSKTNGNGFFSLYYTHGNTGGFLPAGDHWSVRITGYQDGCRYDYYESGDDVIWQPVTDPSSYGYYVDRSEMNLDPYIPILPCLPPEEN